MLKGKHDSEGQTICFKTVHMAGPAESDSQDLTAYAARMMSTGGILMT